MAFTKQAKPTSNFTKAARQVSGRAARFLFARFGQARFGKGDSYDKTVRPTANFTKTARP